MTENVAPTESGDAAANTTPEGELGSADAPKLVEPERSVPSADSPEVRAVKTVIRKKILNVFTRCVDAHLNGVITRGLEFKECITEAQFASIATAQHYECLVCGASLAFLRQSGRNAAALGCIFADLPCVFANCAVVCEGCDSGDNVLVALRKRYFGGRSVETDVLHAAWRSYLTYTHLRGPMLCAAHPFATKEYCALTRLFERVAAFELPQNDEAAPPPAKRRRANQSSDITPQQKLDHAVGAALKELGNPQVVDYDEVCAQVVKQRNDLAHYQRSMRIALNNWGYWIRDDVCNSSESKIMYSCLW